jgi:NAD(P)-dependent dehydrogenase (short-subunit alcohol dehydrogenase family)
MEQAVGGVQMSHQCLTEKVTVMTGASSGLGPAIARANAMVSVFAPAVEITPAEYRRVMEVNYLGYVHGTLAALRHMRARNSASSFRSDLLSHIARSRCRAPTPRGA